MSISNPHPMGEFFDLLTKPKTYKAKFDALVEQEQKAIDASAAAEEKLASLNQASEALATARDNLGKDKTDFESTKADILAKEKTYDDRVAAQIEKEKALQSDTLRLETWKSDFANFQSTKEDELTKRESAVAAKETSLATREGDLAAKEKSVADKLAKLKEIAG